MFEMNAELGVDSRNRAYQKRRLRKGLGLTRNLRDATPKQLLLSAVKRLPRNTTTEEVLDLAYFLFRIEEELSEFEAGRLIPERELEKRYQRNLAKRD
jgi:hypothetical protein